MVGAELGPTAVQRAAEHLLAHLDEIVERITARVWQAVPGYNEILIDRLALEEQVRPNIVDALEFLRSGRDIDAADRARLDDLGRRRALQGVPMAAMVQSFRTAERVLIDAFCVFCIQSSFNSAEQRSGILAIGAILDKVELATLDSYLETQRQLQQDHNSSVAVLVARLVTGAATDRMEVDAQARLVGANPSVPYRCVALSVLPGRPAAGDSGLDWDPLLVLTRLRRHVVSRLIEARIRVPIVGVYDDSLVMMVPVTERDAIATIRRAIDASQYRQAVVGGAGDAYGNLFEARASCQQALAALDVARRQGRAHEVLPYENAVLEVMLLGNRDASQRLISGYLAPLAEHPLLDETIRVYVERGQSAQAAASQLVVHVNTIAYRLRRVAELTGHDIRNSTDAIDFSLALRARELIGTSWARPT